MSLEKFKPYHFGEKNGFYWFVESFTKTKTIHYNGEKQKPSLSNVAEILSQCRIAFITFSTVLRYPHQAPHNSWGVMRLEKTIPPTQILWVNISRLKEAGPILLFVDLYYFLENHKSITTLLDFSQQIMFLFVLNFV